MIQSVEIVNWKGHDELSLSFGEGVNFLVGPNGIGKTSVLDAICFALLGNIEATSIYRQLTYKDLIRDPKKDMEIVLTFAPQGGEPYTLKRAHSARTNRKSCSLSRGGTTLTRSWEQVTAKTLELLEANDLFLRRVILLSEGDTFAYATRPPGEGLTKHIEQVLGINRMEGLRDDLTVLRRQFEKAARRWRDEIKTAERDAGRDSARVQELRVQLEVLRRERDTISRQMGALNREVGALTSQSQATEQRIERIEALVREWQDSFGDVPPNYEFSGAAQALQRSYDGERNRLSERRDQLRDEVTWLSSQVESQEAILKLVEPLERELREVPCPVCKRPLSIQMMGAIQEESRSLIAELEKTKDETSAQLPAVDERTREVATLSARLRGIQTTARLLKEEEPRTLSVPTLQEYLAGLEEQLQSRQEELHKRERRRTELDQQIRKLDAEVSELAKRADEQEMLRKRQSLIRATKGEFVAQLFRESLIGAMDEQRRVLLEPLTQELSFMWSAFMGKNVEVVLKDDASVGILDHRTGTSLGFPQLSGGEKTALLIFTQIMLSKYFSNADFMLIDEPLEHLDARNRWALIKFLVDSCRAGYPRQLIVTTIEEPLIREYLHDAQVTVRVLSQENSAVQTT
jgi:exonuclease SbcC